ncbi:MAG: carbohydrate binding domain-containing protein [Chloroflexota bacterium]
MHRKLFLLVGLSLTALLATSLLITGLGTAVAEPSQVPAELPIIADFEGGIPAGFGGFADSWDGSGSATTLAMDTAQVGLPVSPPITDSTAVSVTYSVVSEIPNWGNAPGYAGVTHNFAETQDWSGYDAFSFWWWGSGSGGEHRVELKADGANANDSNRYAFTFTDDVMGWKAVDIPFSEFAARTDWNPGPNPSDPLNLANMWGYSILLASGTDGTFRLDDVMLTKRMLIHDFEGGFPAGFGGFADSWDGSGSDTTLALETAAIDLPTVPAITGTTAVSVSYVVDDAIANWGNAPGYAGVTHNFAETQDWSDYETFGFWWWGSGSGGQHRVELKADGANANDSNRYAFTFTDAAEGFIWIVVPFDTFAARTDFNPGPSPSDPINKGKIWGYSILLASGTEGVMRLDEVAVYGNPATELSVALDSDAYVVEEGGTVEVTAVLNMTPTETVTVSYSTSDATALAGNDYTAASGSLVFPAGTTEQTITLNTIDDDEEEEDESFHVTLSNPANAVLGNKTMANIVITDNDAQPASGKSLIINDFSGDITVGPDPDSLIVGYNTFNHPNASVSLTNTVAPPEPVPGLAGNNIVLQETLTLGTGQWAGFIYSFVNQTGDEGAPQDWSNYEGFSFWLYGNNTGGVIFVDILDNRTPGSTTDDAGRYSVDIADDFSGWRFIQIPFDDFNYKEIGNGAINDGFTLEEIHGYAIGGFGSVDMGTQNYYVDNIGLLYSTTAIDNFENNDLPRGVNENGIEVGYVPFNHPDAGASITTTMAPPEPIPGFPEDNTVLQETLTIGPGQWAGFTHAFTNETADQWVSQDWSHAEGICFWLYGNNTGGVLFFDVIDNRTSGSTTDDAGRYSVDIPDDFNGWRFIQIPFDDLTFKNIGNGAIDDGLTLEEVHGYALGGFGTVDMGTQDYYLDQVTIYGNNVTGPDALEVELSALNYEVSEGGTASISVSLNMTSTETVTVDYRTAESDARPDRDFVPTSGTLTFAPGETEKSFEVVTLDNTKYKGDVGVMVNIGNATNAELGFVQRALLTIIDDEQENPYLVDDFEGSHQFSSMGNINLSVTEIMAGTALAIPHQDAYEQVLTVDYDTTVEPAKFGRSFAVSQDWSHQDGLTFWYYGSNSGDTMTIELLDNQAATTADVVPEDWVMAWSDEFNEAEGTPPNPNIWTHEVGDGSLNSIIGWGNSESQFYTDDPANASMDGEGNLVIRLLEEDTATTDKLCWYGPCEYTSARLISWHKAEFEYGRIEARVLVPDGDDGLWPAFWMLGTDIDEVGWPQTGEIDIMEYVSRIPTEIFGTIHGPGYAGGASYGNTYDFGVPVSDSYHTFTIDWSPDRIDWYVDGIHYHSAVPEDVAPNEWVYNHDFFLLLNMAIGGNFGGTIADGIPFPQEMKVDYVRVYQAVDSAERFEATFVDNFEGWKKVHVPFDSFTRSDNQPPNAPNDGLGLNKVWGYGMVMPDGTSGSFHMDQVRAYQMHHYYMPVVNK